MTIDLKTAEEVRWGFGQASEHSSRVLVEQQFQGRDHRILVIAGEVVAVAERVPAFVRGDGASSVGALIEAINRDPRRGEGHESVLTRITVDYGLVHERLGNA